MSVVFIDGFDHYGVSTAGGDRMLDGVWAELSGAIAAATPFPVAPAFGARSGERCLELRSSPNAEAIARLILPAEYTTFLLSLGVYLPILPQTNNTNYRLVQFCDNANTVLFTLSIGTTGALILRSGATGTAIIQTQTPPLVAGTWQHVELSITISATVGAFEVRVGGIPVIEGTGLNLGTTDIAQLRFTANGAPGGNPETLFYVDDLVILDTLGGINDAFLGDLRVATLVPNADDTVPWTPRYRKQLSVGVIDLRVEDAAVSAADSTDFEFGSGDYTVEGIVRFHATSVVTRQIIGKWQTTSNQRSWTLELTGSGDTEPNTLRLLVSTDGAAETVIHQWPWQPHLYRGYHVAVSRMAGESYLLIDGIRQGLAVADANTYFAGTAALAIGARMSSATAVVATTGMGGLMDEVRITKGVGRYTGNFTPETAPFGRNVIDDADFASVTLLLGCDLGTLTDEAGTPHTLTARNSAAILEPDDGAGAYTTINQLTPRDDTHVEAALVPAYGILTLDDNPANTETVTIDGQAYTFKTALASAYDVLIGATLSDTLDNLVAAINDAGVEGTNYGTGTDPHATVFASRLPSTQIRVVAITAGAAGNSLATSLTADGVWEDEGGGGTTLQGGADIPAASTFFLSRLPRDVTVVRAISIVTRAYKNDAGTSVMQTTFIAPAAGTDAGAAVPLTVDPTYHADIVEVDPDTMGGLTPATLLSAKIKIDRTE